MVEEKGSTAVNVYQYKDTAGKDFQTAVKAFDVSQLQEPSVAGTPPLDSPMPLKTMMDAMLQTAKGLNFVTERSSVLRGSGFVPAEDGKPARLILSKLLNQTEVRQESLYLYTLLHLSHREGFSMNPETYFTARCAANILCKRYGGEPKELTAFPESITKYWQVKELLTCIDRAARTTDGVLQKVLGRTVQREQPVQNRDEVEIGL